ncbi:hypothetical protein [Corynebacterium mastitidis]
MSQHYDLIVIGGSAAGVAAALTAGRCLRRTLVVDAGVPRNRFAAHMHNTVGFDGRAPGEFVNAGRAEARGYGVEFVEGTVTRLRGGRWTHGRGHRHRRRGVEHAPRPPCAPGNGCRG